MKKLLVIGLLFGFVGMAHADLDKFTIPKDRFGTADPSLKAAGVDIAFLVTSTTPALLTDSESVTLDDGFIHWVILGSTDTLPAGGLFLEIRSTNTANITSARLIPRLQATENSLGTSGTPQVVTFDPPISFSDSLSVNIGPAATVPDGAVPTEFAIGVRWKQQ